MSVFKGIPGNIKSQMMPFVLKPDATLNKEGDGYKGRSDPQYFTYKDTTKYMWSGCGKLNFCPTSIQDHFNDDIGNKLIFESSDSKKSMTFSKMLNTIPGVQIREFLPDTALDQFINFFTALIKNLMSLFGSTGLSLDSSLKENERNKKMTKEQVEAKEAENQGNIFEKLKNAAIFVIKYITATDGEAKIIKDMLGNTTSKYGYTGDEAAKIIDFPYALYYELQSCTTTNIYEIPAIKPDNVMYSSNGAPGWSTADSGFRMINKSMSSMPVFGSLLSKLFGNIGISWLPYWDALNGNGTVEPTVNIEFDLFNDNIETTIINFIFVNTLIANNKWLQYGLFQHSSCLYDIKLEGYNRLFACTGEFTVEKRGILRMPPPCFFEGGEFSLKKYINSSAKSLLENLKKQKSIMIPDIYHVKMKFDSLLPANFNQYLYTLVANQDPIEKYYTHTYDESKLASALTNVVKGVIDEAKKGYNS